jgi:spore cortex formation protein SpoVR/YcgB (stage V sporulation)
MKGQTAVEWLEIEIRELEATRNERSLSLHLDLYDEYFKQAKEMEKDQICEAYAIGGSPLLGPWEFGEDYYNENFKQQEQ